MASGKMYRKLTSPTTQYTNLHYHMQHAPYICPHCTRPNKPFDPKRKLASQLHNQLFYTRRTQMSGPHCPHVFYFLSIQLYTAEASIVIFFLGQPGIPQET